MSKSNKVYTKTGYGVKHISVEVIKKNIVNLIGLSKNKVRDGSN